MRKTDTVNDEIKRRWKKELFFSGNNFNSLNFYAIRLVSFFLVYVISLSVYADKIKVGIFTGNEASSDVSAYASRMCNLLKEYDQFEIKSFSTFDIISQYDVIFLSGTKVGIQSPCWKERIIMYTANGGATILMGASTGFPISWADRIDYCPPLFEEIFAHSAWCDNHSFASSKNEYNIFEENLNWGSSGRYETLNKGKYGVILVRDSKNMPIVIAGAFGKGKVVGIGPILNSGGQTESLKKYMQDIFVWAATPWTQTPALPTEIEEYIKNAQLKIDKTKNAAVANKDSFLKKINEASGN